MSAGHTSDLLAILSQGSLSLSAHRAASATASHNLQNANTPGYARQRAELAAMLPAERVHGAFLGRGAELLTVSQARDRFLEAQLPSARGQASASFTEASALQSVSALDPDQAGNLTEAIGVFYGALRQLSQNPSDLGLRQAAVSSGRALGLAFNRTAQGVDAARDGLDAKVSGGVQRVNTLATQVASLNRQVRIARASGAGEPNDLLDARQKALDELYVLTGATPVPNAQGDASVALAGGVMLVSDDRAAALSTVVDPANGGHLALQLTRADGTGPQALATSPGGELGGLVSARDGALKVAEASVDQLAWDLSSAINASHQAGFGLDGATGRALFDVGTGPTGAASRFAVSATILADPSRLATAASAASLPGDASNLLVTIATQSAALSGGQNASQTLSGIVTQFGATAERIAAISTHDAGVLDHLDGMRESISGVSIDEEMVNLTRSQRAYEAVLKVIQTTDEMLETLMQLK